MISIKLFCYGSLRSGFWNQSKMGTDAKLLGVDKIKGQMYLGGHPYPFTYEGEGEVKGEIWDIPTDRFEAIKGMELGAGYFPKVVKTQDLKFEVVVFFTDKEWGKENSQQITDYLEGIKDPKFQKKFSYYFESGAMPAV